MLSLKFFPLPAAIGLLLLAFMTGACFGSFINCIQLRVKDKKSVLGRSECPNCGHRLGFFELIPVFSYLFLRGKCKNCREKISPRYFLAELCFGLAWALTVAFFGWQWLTLEYLVLFTVLCAEALWDLDIFKVPDTLHILAILNFLIFLPTHPEPLKRLLWGALAGLIYALAILVLSLIMDKVYKKESIGGADIKLLFVLGLYFGWKSMLLLLILSCFIGLLLAAVFKAGLQKTFPFIPALVVSAFICAVWAERFIGWYMSLFDLGAHTH